MAKKIVQAPEVVAAAEEAEEVENPSVPDSEISFLFDRNVASFTNYSEVQLSEQGYNARDIKKVKRVLKAQGLSLKG